ncbi:DNA-binding response regulator [Tyzzerella sp. An114]|uniref:response regulator transcription factor n=1 Tax=Tyzzerella sp. An114 TaxID=1965545 RepID=UPI000B441178|nr:response regulator transcription factor [Tyzzerella sp. An114]OUQ60414.1 DNA-binding response regulator [Tyzzerella sp. An114]
MDSVRVLIIEDEVKLARFVELELRYEGYDVTVVHNGREGLETFLSGKFDLILLDLMLPGLNGIEICRRIRKTSDVPIIMLTAKDEVMDKVSGLDSGADDYLTKPFAIEELLARMRVALKHSIKKEDEKNIITVGNFTVDADKRIVKVDSDIIDLTKKEFELLLYLVRNKNIVLSREQILNSVWGYTYMGETNVVDVYVRYLRSKLDEVYDIKYIHTVRGVGYIVKDEED